MAAGGWSHGHSGAAALRHVWPLQCFLVGVAFTACELRVQRGPLSSLGECPPRREERTPEAREEEKGTRRCKAGRCAGLAGEGPQAG